MATKKEIFEATTNAVQTLLEGAKVTDEFKSNLLNILKEHLEPKKGGGGARGEMHPAILNEDGTIKEAWCRYHNRYEPAEDMVIVKRGTPEESSKGHCFAVNYRWNEIDKAIKEAQTKSFDALEKGEFEEAQKQSAEAKRLKSIQYLGEASEMPEGEVTMYNYEQDWADLKAHKASKDAVEPETQEEPQEEKKPAKKK